MTLLLLVLPASAADFTVRTDGTGDYSRLQACANAVAPGDRCVVTGSFDERVRVRTSGEEALPISFVADGVASVRAFSLDGASHIVIEGFDITHDGMSSDGDSSVLIAGATDVRIEGNTVHDTDATCIELDPNAASSSVVIRGNTITRCGFASGYDSGGVLIYGNGNRVEENDISHVADYVLLFGDFDVMRDNDLHDSTWDELSTDPHIDAMQTYCSTTWNPLALRWALVEGNHVWNCPEEDCHFIITQDEGGFCGHHDLLVRYNVVQDMGSYLVISNEEADGLRYYNNTATGANIAFDPRDWASIYFVNGATGSKVLNNVFADTTRDGGTVYEYDSSSEPGSDHGYNLAWGTSCGTGCRWGSPMATDPGNVLNADPQHDPSTGELSATSPAIDAGRALAFVAASDAGSGTVLLVDDAGFFQDGWAGIDPDVIAIGSVDTRATVVDIDDETDTVTLDAAVTRSPGDPVWLARTSTTEVLAGATTDIGAWEFGAGAVDTGTSDDSGDSGPPADSGGTTPGDDSGPTSVDSTPTGDSAGDSASPTGPKPKAGGGCGCATRRPADGGTAGLVVAVLVGLATRRRRGRGGRDRRRG